MNKYIKTSQSYFGYQYLDHKSGKLIAVPWPKTVDDLQKIALVKHGPFNFERFEASQEQEPELIKKVLKGDVLFRVNPDLTLTEIYHNIDSSD